MNTKSQKVFDTIIEEEARYKSRAPIYLASTMAMGLRSSTYKVTKYELEKDLQLVDKEDLRAFLKLFIVSNNMAYTTLCDEVQEEHKGTITDQDGNKSYIYCIRGKNRSLEDIYRITLNYFPEAKLLDVYEHLYDLAEAEEIQMIICPDIKRRVYLGKGLACYNFTHPYYYGSRNEIGSKKDEWNFYNKDIVNFFKDYKNGSDFNNTPDNRSTSVVEE